MPRKKKTASNIFGTIRKEFASDNYGLKQFRADVAKLKRKGLVSKTIDARSQQATRYMRNQIRKYRDVLQGKAKVLHIPQKEKSYYKETGHRVKGRSVAIETPHGESVRRIKSTKTGVPQYKVYDNSGNKKRTTIRTLVPFTDLEAHILETINSGPDLKRGEYYAFRFFGYNSRKTFSNKKNESAKEAMFHHIMIYRAVEEAIRKGDMHEQHEIYANFETIIITDRKAYNTETNEAIAERAAESRRRNNIRLREWRKRHYASLDELEKRAYNESRRISREADAERKRLYRREIARSNPERYLAEKASGAERMKKSRANRKAKKS